MFVALKFRMKMEIPFDPVHFFSNARDSVLNLHIDLVKMSRLQWKTCILKYYYF